MPYFVVGGEYSDTTFHCLVKPEPVLGPFSSWDAAYERWRERAIATMDLALVRFSIVEGDELEAPAAAAGRAG
jgi:hypothetical protein